MSQKELDLLQLTSRSVAEPYATSTNIPLPDNSVDVIISNCVINLSADKDKVLREAFRVLKPGGRFAVSDVVTRGEITPEIRKSILLWVGCIAGALDETDHRSKLAAAGFQDIDVEPTRIYRAEEDKDILAAEGLDWYVVAAEVDGRQVYERLRTSHQADGGAALLRSNLLQLLKDARCKPPANVPLLCTGNSARSIQVGQTLRDATPQV